MRKEVTYLKTKSDQRVVSEETGKVSVAPSGKLEHGISLEQLEHTIEESLNETRRSH